MDMRPVSVHWATISNKTFVFAHQSVGSDILLGIREISERVGVTVAIVESRSGPTGAGIWHFKVGRNGDPKSKIRDFVEAIDAGAANGADIASVKLCYLDFSPATNAIEVADAYIEAIEGLSVRHPSTRFVAITTPLTVIQSGPKALLKRLIGRSPAQLVENQKRAQFNARLRMHFGPSRLFDLAHYESSGSESSHVSDVRVDSLNPVLTYDGGHLNETGRLLIASQLLRFLGAHSGHDGQRIR